MSQLINAAHHGYIAFPELAISSTTSHCAEQEVVDLDDLAHLVGGDEGALSSSGINSDKDTLFEFESERGSTLREICHLGRHRLEMPLEVDLILNGGQLKVETIRSNLVSALLLSLSLRLQRSESLLVHSWGKSVRGGV